MGKRTCKNINMNFERIRSLLTNLKELLVNESISDSEFKELLNDIRILALNMSDFKEADFNKILKELNIDKSFITILRSDRSSLINLDLAFDKLSEIFKTDSYGVMSRLFKLHMFKALYLDNTDYGAQTDKRGKLLNDTIRRIPIKRSEVNANIINFKNTLINSIADYFGIERPSRVIFNPITKKANYKGYKEFLQNPVILAFISTNKNNLQTATRQVVEVFSLLFILNNFDQIVNTELNKILVITSNNFGSVDNFEYIVLATGNLPDVWTADDLASYGADLYASNLGKFILSTIPKVNTSFNNIEGAYMQSQDAFVIAALLREAEYEYHITQKNKPNYNPKLSLRTGGSSAVKTLMELGLSGELSNLAKYAKEIFPIYNWLYGNKNGTIGVRLITYDTLNSGRVTNVSNFTFLEDIIIGEITKNAAAVYLEYTVPENSTTFKPIRTIYTAHTFRGTLYIKAKLLASVENIFRLDYSLRNSYFHNPLLFNDLQKADASEILNSQDTLYSEFRSLFSELFGVLLNENLLNTMIGTKKMSKIIDVVRLITLLINKSLSADRNKAIDLLMLDFNIEFNKIFNNSNNKSDLYNSFTNIVLACADVKSDLPITMFRNNEGKSIPIYRLDSQIFEDIYLINHFKLKRPNRGQLNFFINNTHTLSNINNPNKSSAESYSYNAAYLGSTGLKLETISGDLSIATTDSSASELFKNNFFGDFLALGLDKSGHSISVLVMTYSDKASVFSKIVNLDAIITNYGDKQINKSLDLMTNDELLDIAYFYEKNQHVDRVYKILQDWAQFLDILINLPDINVELMNTEDILETTKNAIDLAWKQINEALNNWQDSNSSIDFTDLLEARHRILKATNKDVDIVKELHFRQYGKKAKLNKSIFAYYQKIRNKQAYLETTKLHVDQLFRLPVYQEIVNYIANNSELRAQISQYCESHQLDPNKPFDLFLRHRILDNFIRSLYIDLGFKGSFLDSIKGMQDYDEFGLNTQTELAVELNKNFTAAGKRTVDLGGTKTPFALKLLGGVSQKIKVSHVHEPEISVFNPDGEEGSLEILNGVARTNYIYFLQELVSLNRTRSLNISLKTLWSHVGDYSSTLYKWAENTINTWHMRTSARSIYLLERLFKKMSSIPFNEDIDLTKSFLNPSAVFTPMQANEGNSVYFASGMLYFRLNSLERVDENTYDLNITEVDNRGNEYDQPYIPSRIHTKAVQINTLYDLFKVLGGMESMEIGEDGYLTYSDNSLIMLYNYVTNIGTIIDEGSQIYDQSTVRLPLRDKFIAVNASDSAIKRGVTNLNSNDIYLPNNNDELLYSEADTTLAGLQVDYGHNVEDESVATEPTQTLAALATNGTNIDTALLIYEAIATIIDNNLKTLTKYLGVDYNTDTNTLMELSKEISKACAQKGTDVLNSIINLCNLYLGGIIPISENSFFSQFHTQNIIQLNLLALKRKYPGLGGILTASSLSFLLFNVGGQSLTYEDIIKRARTVFADFSDELADFTTDDIVNFYLYSKTTSGQTKIWEILNHSKHDEKIETLKTISNIITEYINRVTEKEDNYLMNVPEQLKDYVGEKIEKGDAELLETVIYKRNGEWERLSLDTLENIYWFYNNPDITDVYRDITVPADLKPQQVTFVKNGIKQTLYNTDSSLMLYELNQLTDELTEDMLYDLEEDGKTLDDYCLL